MAIIPHNDELKHNLNEAIIEEPHRDYLGLSGIGDECIRRLQLTHYWAYKRHLAVRQKRIFRLGHNLERMMINDIQLNGYAYLKDFKQAEIIGTYGHWKGHVDGVLSKDGNKLLFEMKTYNDSRFKKLKKEGVRVSAPGYYDQCQSYMGYLKLKVCLFLAVNKNDCEYYYEFIDFSEERFQELKSKELEVLTADELLPRIGNNNPTWFKCKMCDARNVCFGKTEPDNNCRTCKNIEVLPDGKWKCGLYNSILTTPEQEAGCNSYELDKMFIDL